MAFFQDKQLSAMVFMVLAALAASPLALKASETPEAKALPKPATPSPAPSDSKPNYCAERFTGALTEAILGERSELGGKDWKQGLAGKLKGEEAPSGSPPKTPSDGPKPPRVTLAHYIATLPDPMENGSSYAFETGLEAIKLGLEKTVSGGRYFRTAEWLPWYEPSETKKALSEECRSSTPGFVVFRSASDDHLALVLIVGESPSGGIWKEAMAAALSLATLLPSTEGKEPRRLRILGPTFSGSVASLKQALSAFPGASNWNVSIVSGTATGPNVLEQLRDDVATAKSTNKSDWFKPGQVEFWTTTVPEAVLQCRYLAFLHHWLRLKRTTTRPEDPSIIPEVAVLSESGTEFGAQGDALVEPASRCRYQPAFRAEFPANISTLRDAYEAHDRSAPTPRSAPRRTSLDISLREPRAPPGLRGSPSPRLVFANDQSLSRTIAALERQRIKHIAIHATEIADAIFIARRIRDVAPEIRTAIFQADTLLLHPDFREILFGSLVVTPYPFLGSSDFIFETGAKPGLEEYRTFQNSNAQGVYNAMLALRGANTGDLEEYALTGQDETARSDARQPAPTTNEEPRYSILPVWITSVGARRFVPLTVTPSVLHHDRNALIDHPIYPGLDAEAAAGNFLARNNRFQGSVPADSSLKAWRVPFQRLHEIPKNVRVSRKQTSQPWCVLMLLGCLFACVDLLFQKDRAKQLDAAPLPAQLKREADREVDLVGVRMKWLLYAVLRQSTGILTVTYLTYWTWTLRRAKTTVALTDPESGCLIAAWAILGVLVLVWCITFGYFLRDFIRFLLVPAKLFASPSPRDAKRNLLGASGRWFMEALQNLGLLIPLRKRSMMRVVQFRAVLLLVLMGGMYLFLLTTHVQALSTVDEVVTGLTSPWIEMITTERTLTLVGGVSPAGPSLLLAGIIYLWTRSRMAHLLVAHGLSRLTPDDGVADFVATPIRMILYPRVQDGVEPPHDDAFTLVERTCTNSILRPMLGPHFLGALLVLVALPFLLFLPSAIATLERDLHWPLVLLFFCGYLLIAGTLLQFMQYWTSLELLLKSIYQHPLGRAFKNVAPFVRESLDKQITRVSGDLLRLAGCVGEFERLQRWGNHPENELARRHDGELRLRTGELKAKRDEALQSLGPLKRAERATQEAELAKALLLAAQGVMSMVDEERERDSSPAGAASAQPNERVIRWINDVEAFAATIVAVLLSRHVRQLRPFVYFLLTASFLFTCAIQSYPFEPKRLLTTCGWVLILASTSCSVWTYIQLDRNSLLSDLASTPAGKVTANASFLFRIVAWGFAPILAAWAADYPDLAHTLVQWLRPLPIWQ